MEIAIPIFWISFMVICLGAAILDVVINKINPYPKMQDVEEEKRFSITIYKTRKMYEFEKR